ncbi:FecR family protein [Brevundimonas diminuta]|uniref:FecR family protein n=1 Tax=Brevundimonas diminuta TaxID=293 RepID=UPI003D00007B
MTTPTEPVSETPLRQAVQWSVRLNEAPGDDGLRLAFERWLDQSPAHAVAWADAGHVSQLLGRLPVSAAAPGRRPGARIAAISGMAAALLALAVMAPSTATRWGADYITGAGQEDSVTLADGSVVRLAPRSAIKVRLDGDRRDVRLLEGEAYFEVAPDADRPFHVDSGETRVTVLGTGFDVRRGETGADVAVRHGRVRVQRPGAAPIVLTDGDWSRARRGGEETGSGSPQVVGAWGRDRLTAVDHPVSEMLHDARRHHTGAILLTNRRLAERTVTGVYDMTDPAAGLAVMVQPLGGRVRRITPWLILVS